MGATSNGNDGDSVCLAFCSERHLTPAEVGFYHGRGIPENVLNGDVLINGVPPAFRGSADGVTIGNKIYLSFGIGPALSSPYRAGVIGHEIFHTWQYSTGATLWDFVWDWAKYGHDLSPLEVPAIKFGRSIQVCRTNHTC
jgi:hypothetical protein